MVNSNIIRTLGSILILAGTSIGAGMLALPLTTGASGLVGASLLLILCCCYIAYTLLLYMEVNFWDKDDANLVTMVKKHLGLPWVVVAWAATLALLYAANAAYMSAGGSLLMSGLNHFGFELESANLGIFIFVILFGLIALTETKVVDVINRFLMIALISAFVALVFGALPSESTHYAFESGQYRYLYAAFPVVLLSFACQPVFPSICAYMNYDSSAMKKIIFFGLAFPFVFYMIWEVIIIGLLPMHGEHGLVTLANAKYPVAAMTAALEQILSVQWLSTAIAMFSFFALTTSYLAVSLSLADFLADGLKLTDKKFGRTLTVLFTLLPPLFFAMALPGAFIYALGYAGVFVAILYGILPALMVWRGRYQQNLQGSYRAPGGKLAIIAVIVIAVLTILFQVALTFNVLPTAAG